VSRGSDRAGGAPSPRKERLAAKLRAMERHLGRVEAMLPEHRADLAPMTAACDAVTLHLWQAVQLAIDVAIGECAARGLGTPPDYASAFRLLGDVGTLPRDLAERLVRAVGFRNAVAHAYESLDLGQLWDAGSEGPRDLRAFMAAIAAG
jgi:uncharacterized protein YutE (UPF0331/DUF86 family)